MPDPAVPDEAVQAGMKWLSSTMLRWQYVNEDDVREILAAASPFVAAKALREAAVIAELTGTKGPHAARSPMARRTWQMVAKWLRARADNTIGDARG